MTRFPFIIPVKKSEMLLYFSNIIVFGGTAKAHAIWEVLFQEWAYEAGG